MPSPSQKSGEAGPKKLINQMKGEHHGFNSKHKYRVTHGAT